MVDPGTVITVGETAVKGVGALKAILDSNADCVSFYRLLTLAAARAICRDKPDHPDVVQRAEFLVTGIRATAEAQSLQPASLPRRYLAKAKKYVGIKSRPDVEELTRDGLRTTFHDWTKAVLSRQALVNEKIFPSEPDILERSIGCQHVHGSQVVADRLGDEFLDVLHDTANQIGADRKFARMALENIDKADKALGGPTPTEVAAGGALVTAAATGAAVAASAPTATTAAVLGGGVVATSVGAAALKRYRDGKQHGTPLGATLERAVQLWVLDMTLLLHALRPVPVVEDLLTVLGGQTLTRQRGYEPDHAADLFEQLTHDLLPRLTRDDADPQLVTALEGAGDFLRRVKPDRQFPFVHESCGQLREVLRLLDASPLRLDDAA